MLYEFVVKYAPQLDGNMADRGQRSHNIDGVATLSMEMEGSISTDAHVQAVCCCVFVLCEVSGWRLEWGRCEPKVWEGAASH